MPDWQQHVSARLGVLGLGPGREVEIVAELADHLDDLYEDCLERGLSREEAERRAFAEVSDWQQLSTRIRRAKQEDDMNERTRNLWMPGGVTLVLSMVSLLILSHTQLHPQAIWVSAQQPLVLYVPWLLTLPGFGGLGAYWSRRCGGRLLARMAAGLFPAAAFAALFLFFTAIFLLVLPFTFVLKSDVSIAVRLTSLAVYLLNWVVIPGAFLLVGAVPFLRTVPSVSTKLCD